MSNLKIYATNLESTAQQQINELVNTSAFSDAKVRIMPDAHAGAGCVIGFTANMADKVVPNLIGVDIGCGMLTAKIDAVDVDLELLDKIVHRVPSGFNVHKRDTCDITQLGLICIDEILNHHRQNKSMGTLGGGNHFIEANIDDEGNWYLVVHSGSRNLGLQVAQIYQAKAWKSLSSNSVNVDALVQEYKATGRAKEIASAIADLKAQHSIDVPKDLAYLTGETKEAYLHDMRICQQFAKDNREKILSSILIGMGGEALESFHTVHNYVGDDNIIRKGAISAYKGERVLIPFNMRDGSIIAIGKGNEDWNNSAPHGAGRIMSRSKARKALSYTEYQNQMKDVYTTSVTPKTIDEAPNAYKPMQEILDALEPTVEIIKRLKPVYNFKAQD